MIKVNIMHLSYKERAVLRCIEDNQCKRYEIVIKMYQKLTEQFEYDSPNEICKSFEKFLFENSINISLIQEINNIIDEMLLVEKLKYKNSNNKEEKHSYPSPLVQYVLSKGDNNSIKLSESTQSFLKNEEDLKKKEKIYNTILYSSLSPTLFIEGKDSVETGFFGRKIITNYQFYSISKGKNSLEGYSDIEIQYFKHYIVLIERSYDNNLAVIGNNLAVIDREFYEKNDDKMFSYYLPSHYPDNNIRWYNLGYKENERRFPYIKSEDENKDGTINNNFPIEVKQWEPFDGLLRDFLDIFCTSIMFNTYEKRKNHCKKYMENLSDNKTYQKMYKEKLEMIDLIHMTAFNYAEAIYKKNIWNNLQTSNKKINIPWWMKELKERRDGYFKVAEGKAILLGGDAKSARNNNRKNLHNIDPSDPLSWPEDVKDALLGDD